MTTTKIQPTEYLNGPGKKAATDTPWWKVRGTLTLTLVCSIALVVAAYDFAGLMSPDLLPTSDSLTPLMSLLSSTPILLGIGFVACLLTLRVKGRPALRNMYGMLALAAFLGAGLNISREVYKHQILESWIERAVQISPQDQISRA